MRTAKYRQLIVALLTMAFAVQVAASATVSCLNPSVPMESHEQMMESSAMTGMMDHSQHMSSAIQSMPLSNSIECCPDCDCSLGGNNSAALLVIQPDLFFNLTLISRQYDESAVDQLAVSLFRPPIIH